MSESSLGGLVMVIDRTDEGTTLTLRCATHARDWKLRRLVSAELLATFLSVIELEAASDDMMRAARHSLRTCVCASPLFDEYP